MYENGSSSSQFWLGRQRETGKFHVRIKGRRDTLIRDLTAYQVDLIALEIEASGSAGHAQELRNLVGVFEGVPVGQAVPGAECLPDEAWS